MRRRGVLLTAGGLALVLVVGALLGWLWLGRDSELQRALDALPADTLRASYTDWADVRAQAGGEGIGVGSTRGEVDRFLDRAYDRGLSTNSAVDGSAYVLAELYGFSPVAAQWEALGQARSGQVVVLGFGEGTDLGAVEDTLRSLGYRPPGDGAGSGGTWVGGADLVASLDPELTPVMQNVAVLPEEGLVLMSDAPEPVTAAVAVVRGDEDGLDAPLAADVGDPTLATVWASDFACADLAMSQAGPEDQQAATALVERAGDLSPLSGLVMAQQPDRSLTVAMLFEDDEQASGNLQPRVDLAAGDAPGQGGSFAERFRVTSGEASGDTVVLQLRPRPDQEQLFGDISSGPVLFATC